MTKAAWVAKLEYLAKTSKNLAGDLLDICDEVLRGASFAYYHPSFIGYGQFGPEILAEIKDAKLRKAIRDAARSLRERKLLEAQKKGGGIISRMTDKGRAYQLERLMIRKKELLPEGEYSVVAFDVPEGTKLTRQTIRNKIRGLGFTLHQRSVWMSKKAITHELVEYVQLVGADSWVTVFQAKKLEK